MATYSEDYRGGEPSVDSRDQQERILARRLRIQRRREAAEREIVFSKTNESAVFKKEEVDNLVKQIKNSQKKLHKIKMEGFEMISKIKTDIDSSEIKRRTLEKDATSIRKENLGNDKEVTLDKFEEITKKWQYAFTENNAYKLKEVYTSQKLACDSLLETKDKLLDELRNLLKQKDKQYVDELKRQSDDITNLSVHMNNQVEVLGKSYKAELQQIESVFIIEMETMVKGMDEKWSRLLRDRVQKEADYIKNRDIVAELYEIQLNEKRIKDSEEFNRIKINLEMNIQVLQLQIQEMQVTYQMNQEKLEYNFQVLRKRDEENLVTKFVQKKKIKRLSDQLAILQKKIKHQESGLLNENIKIGENYKHVINKVKIFLEKAKLSFTSTNQQYKEIWIMNENECVKMTNRIMNINKVLYEQQLCLPWIRPQFSFMNGCNPLFERIESSDFFKREAGTKNSKKKEVDVDVIQTDSDRPEKEQFEEDYFYEETVEVDECLDVTPPSLVNHLFQLLCNETGFLLEEKVWTLLNSLQHDQMTLMKLDSVFSVMKIEKEEDILALSKFFLKKGTANKILEADKEKNLKDNEADEIHIEDAFDAPYIDDNEEVHIVTSNQQEDKHASVERFRDDEKDVGRGYEVDEEDDDDDDGLLSGLMIKPNDVLLALKAFVIENGTGCFGKENFEFPSPSEEKLKSRQQSKIHSHTHKYEKSTFTKNQPKKLQDMMAVLPKASIKDVLRKHNLYSMYNETALVSKGRNCSGDKEYWQKYSVVNRDYQKLWDALEVNFYKYYKLLVDRANLLEKREELQRQNAEYQRLITFCKKDENKLPEIKN